jgi:hypothetical protein
MSVKLFDHAQTKNSMASGMVKKVKPNQAGVQLLVVSCCASHYPNPLSKFDNIKLHSKQDNSEKHDPGSTDSTFMERDRRSRFRQAWSSTA